MTATTPPGVPADPTGPVLGSDGSAPATPPRRRVRVRYVVAALLCAGVVAWLLIGGLAANIVYLRPVSYAVAHRASQGTHRFRMAGQVEPGTIVQTTDGVKFAMTDGKASAPGRPPGLAARPLQELRARRRRGSLAGHDLPRRPSAHPPRQ